MIPDSVLVDIQRRLRELEDTRTRLRRGEIIDDSPLTVALGASSTPYTPVTTIATGLSIGDQVAVLVWGNDLIVLGVIT